MRDIRPASGPRRFPNPEKIPADLPPALPPARPVPVANIQVPASSKRVFNRTPVTHETPPAPIASTSKLKSLPPTPPRSAKRAVRIGQRERKVLAALLGLVLLVAILAGVIFLPKADIKLVLRTAPLLVEEKLTLQAQGAATDQTIPGTAFFREAEVDGTSPVQSTQVIGTKAKGTIQLVNRANEEQKIKEQSRVVTKDGTLFYTQSSVTIPAASNGLSRVPVIVEAAEAGTGGNIDPQRLNFAALNSSAQSLVYAEATEKLSGGTGETINVVQAADIDLAKEAAGKAARGKVEQSIRDELPKGWAILEESWTNNVDTFETTAKEGDKIKDIPYKGRVTVRVMGYEQQALEDHVRASLEKQLDQDFMLFPGPISYTKTVDSTDWQQATAVLSVRVTHTTIPRLTLDTLRQKLAGRSEEEAKTYLEGLPGVRSVNLKLWPFWVNSVPRIEKRINLDLQPERQP